MNEQLQKALADVIVALTESAKSVGSVAQRELPLVVQEYLRWGFIYNLVYGLALVLIGALVIFAAVKLGRWMVGDEEAVEHPELIFAVFGAGGGVVAIVTASDYLLTALQVYVAPRVYLLERIKELVR